VLARIQFTSEEDNILIIWILLCVFWRPPSSL